LTILLRRTKPFNNHGLYFRFNSIALVIGLKGLILITDNTLAELVEALIFLAVGGMAQTYGFAF
jgi:hypothetical protein